MIRKLFFVWPSLELRERKLVLFLSTSALGGEDLGGLPT